MMITSMMSRLLLHFSYVVFSAHREVQETGTCASLEVACFLKDGCTGRISDDVFLNGHHLTHCGNRERVMDVEWYIFTTCEMEKMNMWWDSREELLGFSCFFLFVRCKDIAYNVNCHQYDTRAVFSFRSRLD